MSDFKPLNVSAELSQITEKENKFFQSGKSEGAPYLFYKFEEFEDLMGHDICFYENGVLLVLKDSVKDYTESRSFVFFNNDGKRVFKAHNRRPVQTSEGYKYLRPEEDIQVKVYKDFIRVTKIDLKTKEKSEDYYDVLTGEVLQTFNEGEQLSIDI